jgi:hypothetical protein
VNCSSRVTVHGFAPIVIIAVVIRRHNRGRWDGGRRSGLWSGNLGRRRALTRGGRARGSTVGTAFAAAVPTLLSLLLEPLTAALARLLLRVALGDRDPHGLDRLLVGASEDARYEHGGDQCGRRCEDGRDSHETIV